MQLDFSPFALLALSIAVREVLAPIRHGSGLVAGQRTFGLRDPFEYQLAATISNFLTFILSSSFLWPFASSIIMSTLLAALPAGLDGKLVAGFAAFTIGYTLYTISLGVYYLYFSQLAGFPAPRIAAATSWYEFYYDYWCNGKYIFEIERMHQRYGS